MELRGGSSYLEHRMAFGRVPRDASVLHVQWGLAIQGKRHYRAATKKILPIRDYKSTTNKPLPFEPLSKYPLLVPYHQHELFLPGRGHPLTSSNHFLHFESLSPLIHYTYTFHHSSCTFQIQFSFSSLNLLLQPSLAL